MAIICVLNAVTPSALSLKLWQIIVITCLYTLSAIIIDGIVAFIMRYIFPKKWFSVDNEKFAAEKKRSAFYEKLGIKKWKDKVIELGFFTGFSKSKIEDATSSTYVARYIVEANYGVAIHFTSIFIGFILLLFKFDYSLSFALPVAIVNAFLHTLPYLILRYNLRKLHVLYKYNKKKEQAEKLVENADNLDKTA